MALSLPFFKLANLSATACPSVIISLLLLFSMCAEWVPDQLSAFDEMRTSQSNTKPGQWQQQLKSYTLSAPNGLTLQFPPQREIGRTEVGIIKSTLLGKSGLFFTQH